MTENRKLRYNFVFLFAESDYWQSILGKELYHSAHSRVYLYGTGASKLKKRLFHYHWAYRLNEKFRMPFKSLWYRDMYEQHFQNNLPIVFVFMGGNNIRFAGGFCDYVRKRNPQNKIMILHNDMIAKHYRGADYAEIRRMADLITTYDAKEAEKYGISYFQETTYAKLIPEPEQTTFDYDVFFLGAAKDRLPQIMRAYQYFKAQGLRVKFIVPGVPEEQQIIRDDMEYQYISYRKNLEYILRSKCILEIIQKDSVDITTRALEAIAYRRKFITDCPLDLTGFFNKGQLYQFKDIEEVPTEPIAVQYNPNVFEACYDYSPMKRLYFIQKKLEEKGNGQP